MKQITDYANTVLIAWPLNWRQLYFSHKLTSMATPLKAKSVNVIIILNNIVQSRAFKENMHDIIRLVYVVS